MSDKCPKCGANKTQFEGQTSWDCGSYQSLLGGSHIHRPQFKLMEGECCKTRQALAARESELAEAKQRVAELEGDRDAGRELMRVAWREFNAIRARDGAPAGVCHDYWNEMTEGLRELLGDDAKPWMTGAARALVQPYESRVGRLTSQLVDMELRAIAAENKLADRITTPEANR